MKHSISFLDRTNIAYEQICAETNDIPSHEFDNLYNTALLHICIRGMVFDSIRIS